MSLSQRCARQLLRDPTQRGSIPLFLTPAFSSRVQFSTTSPAQSRVGGSAVSIPPEVSLTFFDLPKSLSRRQTKDVPKIAAHVKGPKGELTLKLPSFVEVNHDTATAKASVSVSNPEIPQQRAMWGTIRALLQHYVTGVSEGHVCVLSLVGVGFRASIEPKASTVQASFPGQQFVSLKVGFSHPVELPIPLGIQASTPQPTRILLESVDKQMLKHFAAEIREWRRPEPYKGKGIFIDGETIKLKAKKIK